MKRWGGFTYILLRCDPEAVQIDPVFIAQQVWFPPLVLACHYVSVTGVETLLDRVLKSLEVPVVGPSEFFYMLTSMAGAERSILSNIFSRVEDGRLILIPLYDFLGR